jgi:hypothetical protein
MRDLTPLFVFAVGILCGCAHTPTSSDSHYFRTVSLPPIALADGERIESVEVVISCARFRAINRIPNDWSVEVVSPVSEVSTFKATAGHGSTSLWSGSDLDDFVTIMICEPDCFDIKAKVGIFVGEHERTVSFGRSGLVMKTSANKSPQETRPGISRCGIAEDIIHPACLSSGR